MGLGANYDNSYLKPVYNESSATLANQFVI